MKKWKLVIEPIGIDRFNEGYTTYEIEAKDENEAKKIANSYLLDPDVHKNALRGIELVQLGVKSLKEVI